MEYTDPVIEDTEPNNGRGSINPPMATEAQPTYVTDKSGKIVKKRQSGFPLLEGAANTVTMGAFDYIPAGMAYGVSKIQDIGSKNPQNRTFSELLDASRERTADIKEQAPISYGVGQLGGALYGGIRMAAPAVTKGAQALTRAGVNQTAAPFLVAPAVYGAQGAVTGAAEGNGDLTEIAKGAGAGAAIGAISQGSVPLMQWMTNKYEKVATDAVKKAMDKVNINKISVKEYMDIQQNAYKDAIRLLPKWKELWDNTARGVKRSILPGAQGAVVGAGAAAATGQDPIQGALYGAGAGVTAAKLRAIKNGTESLILGGGKIMAREGRPQAVANAAAPLATQILSGPGVGAADPIMDGGYSDPIVEPD